MAVVVDRFFAYFDLSSLSHGDLPSEREVIDAEILENAALNVCIKGFDGKDVYKRQIISMMTRS